MLLSGLFYVGGAVVLGTQWVLSLPAPKKECPAKRHLILRARETLHIGSGQSVRGDNTEQRVKKEGFPRAIYRSHLDLQQGQETDSFPKPMGR